MATKKPIKSAKQQAKKDAKAGFRFLGYCVAIIFINGLFVFFLSSTRQIQRTDIAQCTIIVDEIGFSQMPSYRYTATQYWVRSDSVKYWFDKTAIWKSGYKLDETIGALKKGEQLFISYLKENATAGPCVIVDAYSNERIYCTLDGYNKSLLESTILYIIIYFLCTCLFSFIMIVSEGWFAQWIRQRNIAKKKNERALEEAAKAARRAERETLAAQTGKKSATKHLQH